MKVLFIVQGEGRGHMTQALAMEEILTTAGHEVSAIVIGTCNRREVPAYFKAGTKARLFPVASPNFFFDKQSKSINLWKTFLFNVLSIPRFLKELKKIHKLVKAEKPQVIINFYDVLGGYYFGIYNPRVKRICVAHQYLASHKSFPFAPDTGFNKFCFRLTNMVTAINSHKKLALSFRDLPNDSRHLNVTPPLLRREIYKLEVTKGDYILAYVVNKGYAYDLMQWHKYNKRVKLHCFWDNREEEDEWSPWKNLTFHHISDRKFLKLMAGCMGYVSTAGFESICEAMYLGKPVMMMPVKKQYEQACNARDAQLAGAGMIADSFDLGPFLHYLSHQNKDLSIFKDWVHLNRTMILKEIEHYVPSTSRKIGLRLNLPRLVISNK